MKQKFYEAGDNRSDTKRIRAYLNSGHTWKTHGEFIDTFALSDGYHNGPECIKCEESFCWYCTPLPPKCKST